MYPVLSDDCISRKIFPQKSRASYFEALSNAGQKTQVSKGEAEAANSQRAPHCFLNNLFGWNHVVTFGLQNIDHVTQLYFLLVQLKCRKSWLKQWRTIKKILNFPEEKITCSMARTKEYWKYTSSYFPNILQIVQQVNTCYCITTVVFTSYLESSPVMNLSYNIKNPLQALSDTGACGRSPLGVDRVISSLSTKLQVWYSRKLPDFALKCILWSEKQLMKMVSWGPIFILFQWCPDKVCSVYKLKEYFLPHFQCRKFPLG